MIPKGLNVSEGVLLFTDGSSWNTDRSGGWAWVAVDIDGNEAQDFGGVSDTTNNRMEMMAWIQGLRSLHESYGPCEVLVYSDSEYVGLGAIDRTRNRRVNVDLWAELDEEVDKHEYLEWVHVKGHSGHAYNELVDKLAGEARRAFNDSTA